MCLGEEFLVLLCVCLFHGNKMFVSDKKFDAYVMQIVDVLDFIPSHVAV